MSRTLLIVAGEASGDKHAARLVSSLKRKSDLRVVGIGGDEMKAAGVELIHHVREMAVMGFSEIFSKLPFFRKVRHDLVKVIEKENPAAVILVDYPGFNLRVAEIAKKSGVKVIYFISPQIWAWGMRRIKKIRRNVDLMLTIFKFEEDLYRREGVDAHFVGHPLLDEMTPRDEMEIENFRNSYSVASDGKILALLPGSRLHEVNRILPTMLDTVEFLKDELRKDGIQLEVVIGCAPGIDMDLYERIVAAYHSNVRLTDDADLLMSASDAGIIKSGTSTLEAALHGLPMVVVYRTSRLNYLIGRMLVKLQSISLVNIVAGKKIVEELVQNDFTPSSACRELKRLFTEPEIVADLKFKYADLRALLGEKGASDRAADLILKAI